MNPAESRLARQLARAEDQRRPRRALPIEDYLFGPQLAFVADKAPYKTAVCSRRAGKSVGCAAELVGRTPSLYFTLTRINAKRIIWPTLLSLNRKYDLGFEPVESELVLRRNGVAQVYLAGVDNKREIEKLRGIGWAKVVGDEAQALPTYIAELVNDVIMPSLMDHRGSLSLIGTPGPVPLGYFYDCSKNPKWSPHAWTAFENPYVDAKGHLAQTLQIRGLTADDPSIQREFYGRWVHDPNSLVFRWNASLNVYRDLPDLQHPWQYVVGVDLGYDDADAIAVLAFNDDSPNVYLCEEWTDRKQTITQLTSRISALLKQYDPLAIVVDTGGLGKKIAHEVSMRTSIPLKAAEKDRKFEYVELVNDALRSGRFYAKADSRFAHDALLLEWDRDNPNPERPKVSNRFHSDILDAALYAYRESLHWLHVPKAPIQSRQEFETEQEAELVAEMEQKIEQEKADNRLTWDEWSQ